MLRWPARLAVSLTAALALTTAGLPLVGAASASSGPSISSDQADYPPGAAVTLSGAGWSAGDNVHVVVDDADGQTWQWQGDATAGDGGGFDVQLTLPDWFVADYSVLADNGAGTTASTTFTDGNVQVAAKVGSTNIVAGVRTTTYRKDTTCSGTTLNSSNLSTSAAGFTSAGGFGTNSAMSLLAASPVVYNGRLYAFSSWSGSSGGLNGSAALLCVPGSALHGGINETANYTDAGPATKTAQQITFAALADKTFGDSDFTVAATSTSGLAVTFSASGVCTVVGTTVHLTGAGDCTVTADQAGDATYYPAPSVPNSFTVNPGGTTVTVSCPPSAVYTSSAIQPCTAFATGTGLNQSLTVTYASNVDVGTATASASYAGDANHAAGSGSATFTITQASSAVTVTCPASVTYTGAAQTPCTAAVAGAGLSQSLTPSYGNNTNVGTATASASYAGDANHTGSSNSSSFTIGTASSSTTVSCPTSVEYTGAALTPCSATVTGAGLSLTPTPSYASNTNVGTATASYSFTGDANHTGSSDSKTFDITAASSTVSITCPSHDTYTGSALTPCTAKATGAGMADVPLTVTYSANTSAGTATASASWDGDANHTGGSSSTSFTIDKAPSAVTLTCPSSVTYDGTAQQPCSAEVTGAGGLDAPVGVDYTDNTDAGPAGASAAYAGDDNHLASSGSGTFTIARATSTVTVTCASPQTYTGSAIEPCSAKATGVGMTDVTGLAVTYSADHTDVGTVTASAGWTGDSNHTGSTGSSSFDIIKAPSSTLVTCPVSVTYDGSAQTPCTVSVTGAGGLDLTPTADYADNVSAGTATASYDYAGDANHDASSDTKHFAIDKAASTTVVTCPATDPVYTGSAIEPCSAVTTGAGGLNESRLVSYLNNTDAGTATASASYPGDLNHESSSDSESFTIDRAGSTTTITCPSAHPVYTGSPIGPCSATATGVGGLSTPVSVDYTNNTNAGTAGASATYAGDSNHNGSSDSTTFTIDKAASTTTLVCVSPRTYTGSAIEACTATATGAGGLSAAVTPISYSNNVNVGTAGASATYAGDANHNGSSGTGSFTIAKATPTVTVSANPDPTQYSDRATLTATVSSSASGDVTGTVSFALAGTTVGSAPVVAGTATLPNVLLAGAPGSKALTATFTSTNGNFSDATGTGSMTESQENATATYTGSSLFWGSTATASSASVLLSATVVDANDANRGDIRNARVSFVNRDTGATLCSGLPVSLVSSSDTTTGTAACTVSLGIGSTSGSQYTIGIVVSGYYVRDDAADDAVITVAQPLTTGFITGGGFLRPASSAGQFSSDPGSQNNFGFNAKYNKGGTNLQGNVNVIARHAGRVYQFKGNSLTQLAVSNNTANFTAKASVIDITNPSSPISIDGGASIQLWMTDNGSSGDTIALQVLSKSGALYFSSNWSGTKTTEIAVGNGQLVVH